MNSTAHRPRVPALALMAALLAGCAASAPQYYTLQIPDAAGGNGSGLQADYAISVQPVIIPEQVARPQIVVSTSSGAEVMPLNAALWAGPLEAQIRNVLAGELAQRLGVLDVGRNSAAKGLPVWRIYLDVRSFDSVYAEEVRQEVVWRIVPQGVPGNVKERVCSARASVPVEEGMSALVEGHRSALTGLAGVIAQSLPGPSGAVAPSGTPEGVSFRGCVG